MNTPYPPTLKANVLNQVKRGRKSVSDVSRDYGIGKSTIYRWLRVEASTRKKSKEKFIMKQLEQKLKRLADERNILIKAASILAREIDSQ